MKEEVPGKRKENPGNLSCSAFQAQLPELIAAGAPLIIHPHIQNCDCCRALLNDLESIAEAARKLLPFEEPPDKLWKQIEAAIKNQKNRADPA